MGRIYDRIMRANQNERVKLINGLSGEEMLEPVKEYRECKGQAPMTGSRADYNSMSHGRNATLTDEELSDIVAGAVNSGRRLTAVQALGSRTGYNSMSHGASGRNRTLTDEELSDIAADAVNRRVNSKKGWR